MYKIRYALSFVKLIKFIDHILCLDQEYDIKMLYSYIQCIIWHSTKIMTSFVSSPLKGDKLPDQIYPIKASKLTLCYGTVYVGYSIQGHTSYEKGFLN